MSFLSKIFKSKVGRILGTVALGAALGPAGLGLSSAAAGGLSGAAMGALGGGGIKGALLGGATGYAAGASPLGQSLGQVGKPLVGPTISGAPLSGTLGLGSALSSGISNSVSGLTSGISSLANGGLSSILGGGGSSGGSGILSSILGGGSSGGSSLLPTLANVYSGYAGNAAAEKAAKYGLQANKQALDLQSRMYDQTTANMNPFMTSGKVANSRLADLLTGDPATQQQVLENSPGYQFRLRQGTKALNQSLGAKGSLFSGEALKAAQSFGQGLADQTYNDYVQQLMAQSNAGQSAAANQGASGANYANQAGNIYGNIGSTQAARVNAGQSATNQALANIFGSPVGGFSGASGLTPDQIEKLKLRGII